MSSEEAREPISIHARETKRFQTDDDVVVCTSNDEMRRDGRGRETRGWDMMKEEGGRMYWEISPCVIRVSVSASVRE